MEQQPQPISQQQGVGRYAHDAHAAHDLQNGVVVKHHAPGHPGEKVDILLVAQADAQKRMVKEVRKAPIQQQPTLLRGADKVIRVAPGTEKHIIDLGAEQGHEHRYGRHNDKKRPQGQIVPLHQVHKAQQHHHRAEKQSAAAAGEEHGRTPQQHREQVASAPPDHVKHRRQGGDQNGGGKVAVGDAGQLPALGKLRPVVQVVAPHRQHHGKADGVEQLHQAAEQIVAAGQLQLGAQQQIHGQKPQAQAQGVVNGQRGKILRGRDKAHAPQQRGRGHRQQAPDAAPSHRGLFPPHKMHDQPADDQRRQRRAGQENGQIIILQGGQQEYQ